MVGKGHKMMNNIILQCATLTRSRSVSNIKSFYDLPFLTIDDTSAGTSVRTEQKLLVEFYKSITKLLPLLPRHNLNLSSVL